MSSINNKEKINAVNVVKLFSYSAQLRLFNIGIGFLSTLLLTRLLAVEELGKYAYFLSVITLLSIPAALGVPEVLIREVSKFIKANCLGSVKRLLSWAKVSVAITLLLVTIIVSFWINFYYEDKSLYLIVIIVLTVTLLALNAVRNSVIIGLKASILGQIPEMLVKPAIFFLILSVLYYLDYQVSFEIGLGINAMSLLVSFIFGSFILIKLMPDTSSTSSAKTNNSSKEWTYSALPLALLSGMYVINSQLDILMLGWLSTDENVGVYKVVSQIGLFVIFGQQMVRSVVAPRFSEYWFDNQKRELEKLAQLSSKVSFVIALSIGGLFIVLGRDIIRLCFGEVYESGYYAVVILCVSKIVTAAFGSIGNLLNMCGMERKSIWGLLFGSVVNLLAGMFLIPEYGLEGAAIATLIAILVWNLTLWGLVRKYVRIKPTFFGL